MTDVVDKALVETLNKIIKERQYKNYKLEISPVTSGGANYSSRLYAGQISAPNQPALKWFAKVAAISEKNRGEVPARVYEIEQYAYSQLLRLFEDIEHEHCVPDVFRLATPAMYGFLAVAPKEVLVLEDLADQGFKTHNRLQGYSWQYASAAVQQLAELHALSLSLQYNYPQQYEKTVAIFKTGLTSITGAMVKSIFVSVKKTINVIREENRGRVEEYLVDLHNVLPKLFAPCGRAVIAHGDFRMSNMLHKVDENGKIKLVVVDYQTLHIGSAVNDLLYFIATGSDTKFRRQYYQKLVDCYYDQMSIALFRLQLDASKVFPREDFDRELKENLKHLLVFALYALPVVTIAEEDAPVLDDELQMDMILQAKPSAICIERLNDFVDDFIRWGVL